MTRVMSLSSELISRINTFVTTLDTVKSPLFATEATTPTTLRRSLMREAWDLILTAITGLGGALGWLTGGTDGLLLVLIVFVTIDYITGVIAAYATHTLSSAVGFKGIARKILIFAFVALAHLLDTQVLDEPGVLRRATIFFYLANEGISIIENADHINLPIPKQLRQALTSTTVPSHTTQGSVGSRWDRHQADPNTIEPPESDTGDFPVPETSNSDDNIKEET